MPFATAADYAEFKGLPRDHFDADDVERRRIDAGLLNAEDDVRDAVATTLYVATDAAVATALRRATCAQFDDEEKTGGLAELGAHFQSVKIGGVALSSSARTTDRPAHSALGTQAMRILRAAGLLGPALRVIG